MLMLNSTLSNFATLNLLMRSRAISRGFVSGCLVSIISLLIAPVSMAQVYRENAVEAETRLASELAESTATLAIEQQNGPMLRV